MAALNQSRLLANNLPFIRQFLENYRAIYPKLFTPVQF